MRPALFGSYLHREESGSLIHDVSGITFSKAVGSVRGWCFVTAAPLSTFRTPMYFIWPGATP